MRGMVAVSVAVAAATVGLAQPASAIETNPSPGSNPCISGSTFLLTVSRTSVVAGQSVSVSSSIHAAAGCTFLPADTFLQFVDPQSGQSYQQPVGNPMQATVIPPGSGYYDLAVINDGQVYQVGASAPVTVSYPIVGGVPFAQITSNIPDEAVTLEQAVQQTNAWVYIAGDVNLDMTGMNSIHVAPGVQIIGERSTAHPNGPRIFTQSLPPQLFNIGLYAPFEPSDNVRVTGIEFDGGEPSDPCASAGLPEDEDAFTVWNSVGVEFDHDDFHSWNGAAISVKKDADDTITDPVVDRLTPTIGKAGVWVYDNYIHDDQHPTVCDSNPLTPDGHGAGYGVDTSFGGYAYIQGNVFTDDRHAVTGNGRIGSGYTLTGNLFLSPGVDDEKAGFTSYNHYIDMHGTLDCPNISSEHFNCGQGGLYMDVENNIVTGNTAAAIQLRGQPSNVVTPTPGVSNSDGMYVHDNEFNDGANSALTETLSSNGLVQGTGNVFNTTTALQVSLAQDFNSPGTVGPFCDFDGDGTQDPFQDDAGTLWYHSSLTGRWEYLATPNVPAAGLTLGDVTGDGLCDVSNSSGLVFASSPVIGSIPLPTVVPNLGGMTQSAAQDAIAAADLQVGTVTTVASLVPAGTVLTQSLTAGTSAPAGSTLSLTISGGGFAGYQTTFQANTSRQWEVNPNGTQSQTLSALATDGGPSNAGLFGGQYDEAFRASDGTLWFANSAAGGHQVLVNGAPVVPAAGTSPVIAVTPGGHWEIAYSQGGQVKTINSASPNTVVTLGGIAAKSSPAIASAPIANGSDIITVAWVDPSGHLNWFDNMGEFHTLTQFTVWAGTSPAVAYNSVSVEIVATASDSRLWQAVEGFGTIAVAQTPSAVNGTPAVTALSNDTFVQAFQASSGILWVGTSAAGTGTIRVAPNTAPTIAANTSGGWEAAIQGLNGHLQIINSSGVFTDTGLVMEAGTSPSIAPIS